MAGIVVRGRGCTILMIFMHVIVQDDYRGHSEDYTVDCTSVGSDRVAWQEIYGLFLAHFDIVAYGFCKP